MLNYTIKGLLPFTVYRAAVACRERIFWSNWSSEIRGRTLDRGNRHSHQGQNTRSYNNDIYKIINKLKKKKKLTFFSFSSFQATRGVLQTGEKKWISGTSSHYVKGAYDDDFSYKCRKISFWFTKMNLLLLFLFHLRLLSLLKLKVESSDTRLATKKVDWFKTPLMWRAWCWRRGTAASQSEPSTQLATALLPISASAHKDRRRWLWHVIIVIIISMFWVICWGICRILFRWDSDPHRHHNFNMTCFK